MRQTLTTVLLLTALAACSPKDQEAPKADTAANAPAAAEAAPPASTTESTAYATGLVPQALPPDVPAGVYTIDHSHATLIFRVNHLGFSNYTARFRKFEADLQFDPKNVSASTVTATIDPTSLETDFPDPKKVDFNKELNNENWLNAVKFPQITFRSTKVEATDDGHIRIDGELSLHGVTKPVTLNATLNGGYAGHPMDPRARIGLSAKGVLKRSDFGVAYGIPEPGSNMGVGDNVDVIIEAEFNGPPLASANKG